MKTTADVLIVGSGAARHDELDENSSCAARSRAAARWRAGMPLLVRKFTTETARAVERSQLEGNRVFLTGQATAVSGVTVGVYLFRNTGS